MQEQDRRAEKFVDEQWTTVAFDQLKKGDVFRLFEPDGTPVAKGLSAFAESDAAVGEDGVWGIMGRYLPDPHQTGILSPQQAQRFLELLTEAKGG